jgi:hypothetical protein
MSQQNQTIFFPDRSSRDNYQYFQETDYHRCMRACLLTDLVEGGVHQARKGSRLPHQTKFSIFIGKLYRRKPSCCELAEGCAKPINAHHGSEGVIDSRGEGAHCNFNQLVYSEFYILLVSPLIAENESIF